MRISDWSSDVCSSDLLEGETLSAAIGQGYVLANPLQLAVMCSRIASGRALLPSLMLGGKRPGEAPLNIDPEHLQLVRDGMDAVVHGGRTAGRARMQVEGVAMAGTTGRANV